ncbi:MAG: Maf family protein [Rhodospirillales bacterium]|nr:MAG: Maf family protein [Rhodospirillales bacterium]
MTAPIVLASTSAGRRALLSGAGVAFEPVAPEVDEAAEKRAMGAVDAAALAARLAELKALDVSRRRPGAWVVGGDQTLDRDGLLFDKPETIDQARAHLVALRGRAHALRAAICVARDGAVVWRHLSSARLTMRDFSDSFLDAYVAACGGSLTTSVGAYRLEGPGAQLFESIDGDYFTILGLPLLPLLAFLRGQGALES